MLGVQVGVVLLVFLLSKTGAVPPAPAEENACSVDELCSQKCVAIKTLLTRNIDKKTWAAAKAKLAELNSFPYFLGLTNHEKIYVMGSMFRFKSLKKEGLSSWSGMKVGDHWVYISTPGEVYIRQHGYKAPGIFKLPADIPSLKTGDQLLVDVTSAYYPKNSAPTPSDKLEFHGSIIFYRHDQVGGQTVYIDSNEDELNYVPEFLKKSIYNVVERLVPRSSRNTPIMNIAFHRFRNSGDTEGRMCTLFALRAIDCIVKSGGYDADKIDGKTVAEFTLKMTELQRHVETLIRSMSYPLLN